MPCVATVGAIYKELGTFWATFSTAWSLVMAYTISVMVYQAGQLGSHPDSATGWLVAMALLQVVCFGALLHWGRRNIELIPAVNI